jgi:hypothetical protein
MHLFQVARQVRDQVLLLVIRLLKPLAHDQAPSQARLQASSQVHLPVLLLDDRLLKPLTQHQAPSQARLQVWSQVLLVASRPLQTLASFQASSPSATPSESPAVASRLQV